MDKIKFRYHLDEATKHLITFTKNQCFNNFIENYRYIITPNSRITDKHLNKLEVAVLKTWNKKKDILLTADQVVDLLHHDNKVPKWIDTTVYEARSNLTVIDLFCSRRLRDENELMHPSLPPFHLQVSIPPDSFKKDKDGKFDVNWKKEFEKKHQSNNLWARLKKYFG